MARKYRTKLVEVEAMRWPGADDRTSQDVLDWAGDRIEKAEGSGYALAFLETQEGWKRVIAGDWILRDSKGDFRVVPHSDFDETYVVAE